MIVIRSGKFLPIFFSTWLFLNGFVPVAPAAAAFPPIMQLKPLYIDTVLVKDNAPEAVIVVPGTGFLSARAKEIAARIHSLMGVSLEVASDKTIPEDVLKSRNVIAVGNMETNRFIEHLYRQWQVILDLKYPGKGGYVVRSLHNPYGTGHNVIFVGGSDDRGIASATAAFGNMLSKPNNGTLSVGWLMDIHLGQGVSLPSIGAFLDKWRVFSWNDSWRKISTGREIGYQPASTFGWNPISVAGALYYMTGKKEYLDCFKQLALPDPRNIPVANRTDDAFTDPLNPLVKNNHYRSHMVDLIYDLIEESPLFTDRERLQITNKLLEHQVAYDPKDTLTAPNGDRHSLWHLMCIYTGSRYFATYYPSPAWNRRIENVRTSFRSFLGDPTWGDRDTLYWVPTSLEPIFEFFVMDGYDEFVRTGTAKTMLRGLEVLMSGDEADNSNQYLSMGLLLRAAYMTGDSRYLWMLRRVGYDPDVFRIGQSYWPRADRDPKPPSDLVGRIATAPLASADRIASGTPVPAAEAFQVLSYRTGLEKTDDFIMVDGFEGLGRHPYQVNTLLRLRMFGRDILLGYNNDLTVWFNGMSPAHVARGAALKQQFAAQDIAYVHTEVPDMPGSIWHRHILFTGGEGTIVVDRLIPLEKGVFNAVLSWQMGSRINGAGGPSRRITTVNGTGFCSADHPYEKTSDTVIRTVVSRDLNVGQELALAGFFFANTNPVSISSLRSGGCLVGGKQPSFVVAGPCKGPSLSVSADFCRLSGKRILLAGAKELSVGGIRVFASEKPVTLLWDTALKSVRVTASVAGSITMGNMSHPVTHGEQVLDNVASPPGLDSAVSSFLSGLAADIADNPSPIRNAPAGKSGWTPGWQTNLGGAITAFGLERTGHKDEFWAVNHDERTSALVRIDAKGKVLNRTRQPGEILSIWPAATTAQAGAFAILAGYRDDTLRAYSREGQELWNVRTSLHPSFVIGDRYESPWFTNPGPPNNMAGVYSILAGDLWGTGTEEIAAGRPCTVEFRALDGALKARVPTKWGKNTSLALLAPTGSQRKSPWLLAGKAFTGNPQLSGITSEYKTVSDSLFDAISPGFTQMQAWLQRGMTGLRVADLDGNGGNEIVYTLSGNWNELRVYEGAGPIRWMKFFGPDKWGNSFMSALELADRTGGGKAVLVGTTMGWVHAFDSRGNLLWQHRFESGVTGISARSGTHQVVVGCRDGTLALLDGSGKVIASGNPGGTVQAVLATEQGVVTGGETGMVRFFPYPE